MKKTVLITGASSGFGKLLAESLLESGNWQVYASARSVTKMSDLAERGATVLDMDVTNTQQVNAAVERIISETGQIDAVVANAGYGLYGAIEHVPLDQAQYQFDVNVYGVARVVQATLPHMRRGGSGRIVITTSLAAYVSTAGMGWYCASKFALRGLIDGLRQEASEFGVSVSTVEPNAVKTGFEDSAFEPMDNLDHAPEYQSIIDGFKNYMHRNFKTAPGPEPVVDAMVKALTARRPKAHYRPTRGGTAIVVVRKLLPTRVYDWMIRRLFRV